mgnify:CR=1 FL=1
MERANNEPKNYLRPAELSAEGNYNHVDGQINNLPPIQADLTDGQTWDEIRELAPETLPDEKESMRLRLHQMQEAACGQEMEGANGACTGVPAKDQGNAGR